MACIAQSIGHIGGEEAGNAMDQSLIEEKNGAPTRTRTRDPLITNQVLYQLSYKGSTCGRELPYSDRV